MYKSENLLKRLDQVEYMKKCFKSKFLCQTVGRAFGVSKSFESAYKQIVGYIGSAAIKPRVTKILRFKKFKPDPNMAISICKRSFRVSKRIQIFRLSRVCREAVESWK